MDRTKDRPGLLFNIALNYGGRTEITDAVRRLAADVAAGRREPSAIDEATLSSYLYTAGLPDPDLLIRTSGEMRVSNFRSADASRDLGDRRPVARFPPQAPAPGRRRLPEARAEVRRHHHLSGAPGFGSNLARRVATAAVAIPLLVAALFKGPPLLGAGIAAAAVLVGQWEFFGLMRARGLAPFSLAGFLCLGAIFLEVAHPPGLASLWPAVALAILLSLLAGGTAFAESVPAAALTLLGSAYLGALGGAIAALRLLPPDAAGAWRLVLLLAIIMVADAAAFFVGKAAGRHPLAPGISPAKTIEGALGGLAGGIGAAVAVRALGLPSIPLAHALLFGIAVAALGIAGDLVESLLKRWAGVKDSGALFPGHGGMLDRLDSLLFGAPVLYYYFSLLR
jgi:phosphatidate cytidylyltransferase